MVTKWCLKYPEFFEYVFRFRSGIYSTDIGIPSLHKICMFDFDEVEQMRNETNLELVEFPLPPDFMTLSAFSYTYVCTLYR